MMNIGCIKIEIGMLALADMKKNFGVFRISMVTRLRKIIHSPVRSMHRIVKPIKVKLSLVLDNKYCDC